MGEPRCPSSAIPRNLEQADLGRSTPPLATLVYTETKMSTHKHSEAGNELRSLSMIRYDQSMNATTQRSKDSHFWHLTPLPAHRQVHTSHTPTSGMSYLVDPTSAALLILLNCLRYVGLLAPTVTIFELKAFLFRRIRAKSQSSCDDLEIANSSMKQKTRSRVPEELRRGMTTDKTDGKVDGNYTDDADGKIEAKAVRNADGSRYAHRVTNECMIWMA